MLIDSCASGGRRNDLETLRRAVPLLRSDFESPQSKFFSVGNPEAIIVGNQGQTYGLASWVPYFGKNSFTDNDYDRRSHLGPANGLMPRELWNATFIDVIPQTKIDELAKHVDWVAFRHAVDEWRQVADEFYGDYYPLTDYNLDNKRWIAWQFNSPEKGTGLIQAFRRREAGDAAMTFKLYGLDHTAIYVVTESGGSGENKLTGRELMETGLTIQLSRKPQAALITYKRLR